MTTTAWKTGHRGEGCGACACAFEPGSTVVSALFEAPPPEEGEEDGPPFARTDFCASCFDGEADTGSPFSWWRFVVPPPEEKKAAFDLGVAKEFLQRLLVQGEPAQNDSAPPAGASDASDADPSDSGPDDGSPDDGSLDDGSLDDGSPGDGAAADGNATDGISSAADAGDAAAPVEPERSPEELAEERRTKRIALTYLLTLLLMRKRVVKVTEHFRDERGEVMSIRFPPGDDLHEVVCVELGEDETETLREQLGELFDLG